MHVTKKQQEAWLNKMQSIGISTGKKSPAVPCYGATAQALAAKVGHPNPSTVVAAALLPVSGVVQIQMPSPATRPAGAEWTVTE
jgi:hypothetical protein